MEWNEMKLSQREQFWNMKRKMYRCRLSFKSVWHIFYSISDIFNKTKFEQKFFLRLPLSKNPSGKNSVTKIKLPRKVP